MLLIFKKQFECTVSGINGLRFLPAGADSVGIGKNKKAKHARYEHQAERKRH
jgi:hypothetical protein